MSKPFFIVFDGPPGPEGGRFVEVETQPGISIRVGAWTQRDGFWLLGPFQEANDDAEQLHSANAALAEQLHNGNTLRRAIGDVIATARGNTYGLSEPEQLEALRLAVAAMEETANGEPSSLSVATRLGSERTIAQEVDGSRWLEITDAEANAMIEKNSHWGVIDE